MYCKTPHDLVARGPCPTRQAYELADKLLIQSGLYQRAAVWPVEVSFDAAVALVASALQAAERGVWDKVERLIRADDSLADCAEASVAFEFDNALAELKQAAKAAKETA